MIETDPGGWTGGTGEPPKKIGIGSRGDYYQGSDGTFTVVGRDQKPTQIARELVVADIQGSAEAERQHRASTNFGTQFDSFIEQAIPLALVAGAAYVGFAMALAPAAGAGAAGAGAGAAEAGAAGWVPAEGGTGYAGGMATDATVGGGLIDSVGSDWASGDAASMTWNTNAAAETASGLTTGSKLLDKAVVEAGTSLAKEGVKAVISDDAPMTQPPGGIPNTTPPPVVNDIGFSFSDALLGYKPAAWGSWRTG